MSEDCPHCVFEKTESNCRGCFEGSHYKPKPITNAMKIRAMSDEELAEFMWAGCDNITQEACKRHAGCVDCWLDWLREAKDED